MEKLAQEMKQYYTTVSQSYKNQIKDPESYTGPENAIAENSTYQSLKNKIFEQMEKIYEQNPNEDGAVLKAKQYKLIVENLDPIIFPNCPFFFELGIRPAQNWGTPNGESASSWLLHKRHTMREDFPEWENIRKGQANYNGIENKNNIWQFNDVFDFDHHCLNYTKLMKVGVNGIISEIEKRLEDSSLTERQRNFLNATLTGNRALIKIAAKFAEKAQSMLATGTYDEQETKFIAMIAESATHIPANPPRNFYEGLASILFLREATASLESIGISVIGHMDRLLNDLYQKDLAAGQINEETASDLLYRWMLMTDIKFHIWDNAWPETSTCIELGGCDETGYPVFNDVTRLFLTTHHKHKLINPKLNCRYGENSPDEYLELMGEIIGAGHNNFAFLNDDILIPANMRKGKTLEEARLYVNGGCQETIIEGVEHSAGAFYYFNMARAFELALKGGCSLPIELNTKQLSQAKNFEDFYQLFTEGLSTAMSTGAEWAAKVGKVAREINPCPIYSSSVEGCLEKADDYTAGSGKYNASTIAAVGFAVVVDSLAAIKKLVFDDQTISLEEMKDILAQDWQGYESLRQQSLNMPKYGHGNVELDKLAATFAHDLATSVGKMKNERGGYYQPSFFVYYTFVSMGLRVGATPDGRKAGDWLSQGVAPGRLTPPKNLTDIFSAVKAVDYTDYPANAVIDITLPGSSSHFTPSHIRSVLRSFANNGGATLQLNCVSVDDLKKAQENPENYQDLTVRIAGLSARFASLRKDVQDEIINRQMYAA